MIVGGKWTFKVYLSDFFLFLSRSVYDGEEHGRFMEKLDARIRNHDREIEKMCNFHYQGFVDAITEFLKVRAEAQKLKVGWNGVGWGPHSMAGSLEGVLWQQ